MKMFIAGGWADKSEKIEVTNPFNAAGIDTVPKADAGDVDRALAGAVEGADLMRKTPAYERSVILRRAAEIMHDRLEDLARTGERFRPRIPRAQRLEIPVPKLYDDAPRTRSVGVQPGDEFLGHT